MIESNKRNDSLIWEQYYRIFASFTELRVNYSDISGSILMKERRKAQFFNALYSHCSVGISIYLNDSWFLSMKLQEKNEILFCLPRVVVPRANLWSKKLFPLFWLSRYNGLHSVIDFNQNHTDCFTHTYAREHNNSI